jgi:hypothetical protein
MAGVLLAGLVKDVANGLLQLFVEGTDSDGQKYPRVFPVMVNGEMPKQGDWISVKADLVVEQKRTKIRATGILPSKAGEFQNIARVVGVATMGFRYFPKTKTQDACAFGLVTVNGDAAYRMTLFDRPKNLAMKFGAAAPGSTVIGQGRLQYGKEFTRDDGSKDAILEVIANDPVWTVVLDEPKIVDAFMAWGGGKKAQAKAPEKAPEPEAPATATAPTDEIPF